MITLIIWFAAFFCTNPNHTAGNHGSCNRTHVTANSLDDGDTGGETGGHPHNPPPPPPPPGN